MKWIQQEVLPAIHDRQLSEHGGSTGIRDITLLESALARPQQTRAYSKPSPDIAELAASLAFGIARNVPFVDGNKRTAYVAYRTFLALNGADLAASNEEKFLTILALAEGKLAEKDFAAWLRTHLKMDARQNDVHEAPEKYAAKKRPAKVRK